MPAVPTMPRSIRSVLITGTNRAYRATPRGGDEITEALAGILRSSGGLARITSLRRTGAAGLALLQKRLGSSSTAIWDGSGENPYFDYLALADAVLITDSSVPMISEAAGTGKLVHVLNLDGGNAKLARFHDAIKAAAGTTRLFSGRIEAWSDRIPDDTMRAGAALQALVLGRRTRA
ncbi:MAG TPA: ELM1/GtrOC1 family putative glycosyltransferase [Stellaceae bacterium]|jgi:hypothetical protein|nr:ELM1/GtrOC1 family putative glycosyltransferase [Stellaceae bacterium]